MVDVLRYRYVTAVISAAIMISFASFFVYQKYNRGSAFSYSIDFTGGAEALLKLSKPQRLSEIKTVLDKAGWQSVSVREFSTSDILVRVKDFSQNAGKLAEQMREQLQEAFPSTTITIQRSETVTAGIGDALRVKSFYAILLGLLVMLVYIAVRFWSFAFAMGAIVSLFHDAIVVLAFFLFLDRDVSSNLITAVLTMLGYSINDTIVIFSQIRDNLIKMRGSSLAHIVTVSINQTLRRSILTSFATTLSVLAMFVFGGEALRDLSLALLVGIIFGTYSSIYIASPVMMLLYKDTK